jgi:hypothetical protein
MTGPRKVKLSDVRQRRADALAKTCNGGLTRPKELDGTIWLSCDLCTRFITYVYFRSCQRVVGKQEAQDVCHACYVLRPEEHKKPLYFMGPPPQPTQAHLKETKRSMAIPKDEEFPKPAVKVEGTVKENKGPAATSANKKPAVNAKQAKPAKRGRADDDAMVEVPLKQPTLEKAVAKKQTVADNNEEDMSAQGAKKLTAAEKRKEAAAKKADAKAKLAGEKAAIKVKTPDQDGGDATQADAASDPANAAENATSETDSSAPSSLSNRRRGAAHSHTELLDNEVTEFFRGFSCRMNPVPPTVPPPKDGTTRVFGTTSVAAGNAIDMGGQCFGLQCPGSRVIAARIVPTLTSEGVWVSVLGASSDRSFITLWHAPQIPGDGDAPPTLGTPTLKGNLHAGANVSAIEWVPLPLHRSQQLGFMSMLQGRVLRSAMIAQSLPGDNCSVMVSGILQFDDRFEPVSFRWVVGGDKVEDVYLIAAFRCSAIMTYRLDEKHRQNMYLAPKMHFPAPRAPMSSFMPAETPIAVGALASGESFVVVAQGTRVTMLLHGKSVLSVAGLSSVVAAVACHSSGVYCCQTNGCMSFISHADGRERRAQPDVTPQVIAVRVMPGRDDVMLGTTTGRVVLSVPDVKRVLCINEDHETKNIDIDPLFDPAAPVPHDSGIQYSHHPLPVTQSAFASFSVASLHSGAVVLFAA